jgi:hypothetical protein
MKNNFSNLILLPIREIIKNIFQALFLIQDILVCVETLLCGHKTIEVHFTCSVKKQAVMTGYCIECNKEVTEELLDRLGQNYTKIRDYIIQLSTGKVLIEFDSNNNFILHYNNTQILKL